MRCCSPIPEHYLRRIERSIPEEGLARIDADTSVSPKSLEAALAGVGGADGRRRRRHAAEPADNVFVADPAARPPCRTRPCDGLLPVQQRRHCRAPRASGTTASNASPSSTGTSTTATARRTSSGTIRRCSTAPPTRCRSIPAPAPGTRRARATSSTRRFRRTTAATTSARPSGAACCRRWKRPGRT